MRSSWLLRKIPFAAIADADISFSEYQYEHRGWTYVEVCVQGSTFLVAAGMVVSTVAVGPKGGEEIVVWWVGDWV